MLHYWILCRCGHHEMTPVQGAPKLRAEVLRMARCSSCGQRAAVGMRILWDAGGQPFDSVHGLGGKDKREDW